MPHPFRETAGLVLSITIVLVVLFSVNEPLRRRVSALGRDLLSVDWLSRLDAGGEAVADLVGGLGVAGGVMAAFLGVATLLTWLSLRN